MHARTRSILTVCRQRTDVLMAALWTHYLSNWQIASQLHSPYPQALCGRQPALNFVQIVLVDIQTRGPHCNRTIEMLQAIQDGSQNQRRPSGITRILRLCV